MGYDETQEKLDQISKKLSNLEDENKKIKELLNKTTNSPAYPFMGFEYKAKSTIMGLPLIHVAYGLDPTTKMKRIARGIIAIGDISIGIISLGGLSLGGISMGGLSLGLLLSFGGVSISPLVAVGGVAIGLLSLGGAAIGYYGIGGGVLAFKGIGGAFISLEEILKEAFKF